MAVTTHEIESIVRQVLAQLETSVSPLTPSQDRGDHGVFERLEDAVAAADAAYKKNRTIALRESVVKVIRRAARTNARRLAEMAVQEAGMGHIEDKVKKNLLVADRTPGPEILRPSAISGDNGLTLIENAPWGLSPR